MIAVQMIAVLLVCFLFSGVALASSVKPDESGVYRPIIYINGEKQDLKGAIPPSGSTLVPFRAFFTTLKIEPQFNNTTKTLTAKSGETTITLTSGKRVATLNGKDVPLLQGPEFVGEGIMYVNLRFVAESFGGVVNFDKDTLTIHIDFPKLNSN